VNTISVEKVIESMKADVYPVTVGKFLLNPRRINSYFLKAGYKDFEFRGPKITLDNSECVECKKKEPEGILCRFHTSVDRVLKADNVALDLDSGAYFYKNEIFKQVGDSVVIVYCPHTRLITRPITDFKVRKVKPITVRDPQFKIPEYKNVRKFLSNELLEQYSSWWFDEEFSIVTIPVDRNFSNFCLIPNK
jgi:hypothetical protein